MLQVYKGFTFSLCTLVVRHEYIHTLFFLCLLVDQSLYYMQYIFPMMSMFFLVISVSTYH